MRDLPFLKRTVRELTQTRNPSHVNVDYWMYDGALGEYPFAWTTRSSTTVQGRAKRLWF